MSGQQNIPTIIVHMLSTIDGRVLCDRYSLPYGMNSLNPIYKKYADISKNELGGDAIVMGRTSVLAYCDRIWDVEKYKPAAKFEPFIGKRETPRIQIILDRQGKTYYDSPTIRGLNILAVLGERVSEEYLAHLREMGISYVFAGKDGNDLKKAFQTLYTVFGMKKVIVQGGGEINGSFLKLGMIDEFSIMIPPSVDGLAGIPSIIGYKGKEGELPAAGQSLELLSVNKIEDNVVYLRYKVHKE